MAPLIVSACYTAPIYANTYANFNPNTSTDFGTEANFNPNADIYIHTDTYADFNANTDFGAGANFNPNANTDFVRWSQSSGYDRAYYDNRAPYTKTNLATFCGKPVVRVVTGFIVSKDFQGA